MLVLNRRPTRRPVGIYLASDCVSDPETGWNLCGLTVNALTAGEYVQAGFTVSQPAAFSGSYSDGYSGIVTDINAIVVAVFPSSGPLYYVAAQPNFFLNFLSEQAIPSGLTDSLIQVYFGPADFLAQFPVGSTLFGGNLGGVGLSNLLEATVYLGSGQGASPPPSTSSTPPSTPPSSSGSGAPSSPPPSTTPGQPSQSGTTNTPPKPTGIVAWWDGLTSTDKLLVGAAAVATAGGVALLASGRE